MTGHQFDLLLSRGGTKAGRVPGRRAAALAAAVVVGGGMWLTVPAASASSTECGTVCINLFNQKFGTADVAAVPGGAATVGQPVILSAATPSTTEDWREALQGTVTDFYTAGLMNATLDTHYGRDEAFEFEYAPGGIDSGMCLGIASGPSQSTPVTLQPCGVSVKTVWILDTADASGGYTPLISGNDAQYPAPYVLTADTAGANFTTQALKTSPGAAAGAQRWKAALSGVPDWADSSFCHRSWEYAPNGASYIGITYKGVAACGNADTNSTSNDQGPIFYTTPAGNTVYFDNGQEPGTGFQCVELTARYFYFQTTQIPPASSTGSVVVRDLANTYGYGVYPASGPPNGGTTNFQSSLTAGNIISMWSSSDRTGAGHVAVVTYVSVNSGGTGYIDLIDENASDTVLLDGLGNDRITVKKGTMSYYGLYNEFQWTTNLPVT